MLKNQLCFKQNKRKFNIGVPDFVKKSHWNKTSEFHRVRVDVCYYGFLFKKAINEPMRRLISVIRMSSL